MGFDPKTHKALAKALGLESLEPETQTKMMEGAGAIIYQAVLVRAMEEMSDESVDEFEKILETEPTPEVIFAFFRDTIPQFDTMIEEEAKNFIEDGQNIMSQIG